MKPVSEKENSQDQILQMKENRKRILYTYDYKQYLKKKYAPKEPPKPLPKFEPLIVSKKTQPICAQQNTDEDSEFYLPDRDLQKDFCFDNSEKIFQTFAKVFERTGPAQTGSARKQSFKQNETAFLEQIYFSAQEEGAVLSKKEVYLLLLRNSFIIQMKNLPLLLLRQMIEKLETEDPSRVSSAEFVRFILKDRPQLKKGEFSEQLAQDLLAENEPPIEEHEPLLCEKDFNSLKEVFEEIDETARQVVPLKLFLKNLGKKKDLLTKSAIRIPDIDKILPLSKIYFELQTLINLKQREDELQFTLEQLHQVFTHYKRQPIPTKDKIFLQLKRIGILNVNSILVLEPVVLEQMKSIFQKQLIRHESFVNTSDLIFDIKSDTKIKSFMEVPTRLEPFRQLPVETVLQTLVRIEEEADKFIDLDEFIDFFTKQGRPDHLELLFQQQKLEKKVEQHNDSSSDDSLERHQQIRVKRKLEKALGKEVAQTLKPEDPYKITVPAAYSFMNREHKESIREKRLKQDLAQKAKAEEQLIKQASAFRASEVPAHVKNTQLHAQLEEKRKKKSQKNVEHLLKLAQSLERPFQFYLREQEKTSKLKQEEPDDFRQNVFVAKPIPWFCSLNMMERMTKEQRAKTQENKRRRQEELQKISQAPLVAFKNLDREDKLQKLRDILFYHETYNEIKSKAVPDFESLHALFESQLEQMRKAKQPTIPKPYNLTQAKKNLDTNYLDEENNVQKRAKETNQIEEIERRLQKILSAKMKYNPQATKKWVAHIEARRRLDEQRVQEEEQKQLLDYDKQYRRDQFANFVRQSGAIQDINQEIEDRKLQREHLLKVEAKDWEQRFDSMMTEMMRRVIRRPLLVESVSKGNYDDDRNQRLNQLLGDNENGYMDQNGQEDPQGHDINQQEQDNYYENNQKQTIQNQPINEEAESDEDQNEREKHPQESYQNEHSHEADEQQEAHEENLQQEMDDGEDPMDEDEMKEQVGQQSDLRHDDQDEEQGYDDDYYQGYTNQRHSF